MATIQPSVLQSLSLSLSLNPPIRALAWVTLNLRKDITLAPRLLVPLRAGGQVVVPLWALSQTLLYHMVWAHPPPCAAPKLLPKPLTLLRQGAPESSHLRGAAGH